MSEWTPEKIRVFRQAHGLTQKTLGELLGVSNITIYQWERGERKPSRTSEILLSRIKQELNKKGKRR